MTNQYYNDWRKMVSGITNRPNKNKRV